MKAEHKRNIKEFIFKITGLSKKKAKYIKYIRSFYDYNIKTPTIICSTCIGGMIYNNLGLKFMSPTINIWMMAHDLSLFIINLDKYLNEKLVFIKDPEYDFPVGKLDDITIYFQHYKSEKEAEDKWNERKTRIDKDNLYVITDDKRLTEEDVINLKNAKIKRLIIFTSDEKKEAPFFPLYTFKGMKEIGKYSVRDFKGFAPFEKEFNYSLWLSGKDNYRIKRGQVK